MLLSGIVRPPRMVAMTRRSSLERKMLTYFGLIAAASLLITFEFIWAIQDAMPAAGVAAGDSVSGGVVQGVVSALASLRSKALLMFVVQAVVTLIVLIMFMRRITGPLQKMVESSRVISEGDLSQTIEIRTGDEIGLLAETINGLTSNIQEIVAFGLSTDASLRAPLADLRLRIGNDPDCHEKLDEIEERLAGFRGILEGFRLLPAPATGTEVDKKP